MATTSKLVECCQFVSGLCMLTLKVTYLTLKAAIQWCIPKTYKDISKEVVLITGGGRGIGRQVALEIAKYRPKHIILWGRKEQALEKTRNDVRALGVKCSYMKCDVSNKDEIYSKLLVLHQALKTPVVEICESARYTTKFSEQAQEVLKIFGPVTVLINNAGVAYGKDIIESCDNEVENTFLVNLQAHIWTLKAFLPEMISKNHGHIVTVSSLLGMMGMKGASDYCSSKFASTGLTDCLTWELEEYDGLRMTSVYPYQVDNEMFIGMKVRFPLIMPPLKEKYVAQKTVSAFLQNRKIVLMPKLMYFVIIFHSILPVTAMISIIKFLGGDTAMNDVSKQKEKVYFEK